MADDRQALHATALKRFKLTADAESPQRTREQEDLRFVDWDEQWPADAKATREGQQANGGIPGVPARPMLTINKLRQPVQQVVNQARSSRLMLQFAPKGHGASQRTAEIFEDVARAVQIDSRAHLARNWAFERAVKCGRGAYRIITQPIERAARDGEWTAEDFDLEIAYKRVLNQASVYFDPFAVEPDWSDGEWCFVTEDLPLERYKRQFPDSQMASMDDGELTAVGDDNGGWVSGDDEQSRTVRIAEYFYVEHDTKTVYALSNGQFAESKKDLPPGVEVVGQRELDNRTVSWCKLNAVEILEEGEWDGSYIPVIPVIADETNINGERRWQGLVRPARHAQQSYNYMRSAQVEGVGLAPKAPFIAYAETIEPYQQWWDQANTRNFPYLPVKFVRDATGNALPPPSRSAVEPAIQAITLAAHEASDDIHATTGVPPVAMGQLDPHERSGKAIQALQAQADLGSSAYLDNLAGMSMQYEGKILRDLIPRVFDRPGRVVAAIGADDERQLVMLNTLFTRDENGTPQPTQNPKQPGVEYYDLKGGEYSVAVKVGKSYTTRLDQQRTMLLELGQAMPQVMPAFADIIAEDSDIPGGQRVADRIRKITGMGNENQGTQADPQQMQMQLQQAQQQMQQMQQMLQQLMQEKQSKTIESQAKLQEAQIDGQVAVAKAQIDAQTKLKIAKINAQAGLTEASIKAGAAETGHQVARDAADGRRWLPTAGQCSGARCGHRAELRRRAGVRRRRRPRDRR